MNTTLYRSTQIESPEQRAQLSRDVLFVLSRGYDLRILGSFDGGLTVYVRTNYTDDESNRYTMWQIVDNGGEFNVAKVNDDVLRSMPYMERGRVVDAGTVAYRIAMAIRGENVDFGYRCPEILADLREAFPDQD